MYGVSEVSGSSGDGVEVLVSEVGLCAVAVSECLLSAVVAYSSDECEAVAVEFSVHGLAV